MNRKIVIRPAIERDVLPVLEVYSPFVRETAVSFETSVPSPGEMWERISSIGENYPFLVCEIDYRMAGFAYATNHRQRDAYKWCKEVSVYVHPGFRGKKVATALYHTLFRILKLQGVVNLLAGITLPNPESIGFHEKMGFRKAGEFTGLGYKLGKWQNVGWWELSMDKGIKPSPQPIIPFRELQDSDAVKNIFSEGEGTVIL